MFDPYEFQGFDPLSSLPFVIFWNLGELVHSGHYDMTTLEARDANGKNPCQRFRAKYPDGRIIARDPAKPFGYEFYELA